MDFQSMADPLVAVTARQPEHLAIIHGEDQLTYRELDSAVNRTARALLGLGLEPGDAVAYLLGNRPEAVIVYYAIQKLGAVAVPLDTRSGPRDLVRQIMAARVRGLIFSGNSADLVASLRSALSHLRALVCVDLVEGWGPSLTQLTAGLSPGPFDFPRQGGAVCRIAFDGGSTCLLQGVLRTHQSDLVALQGTGLSNGLADDPAKIVLIQCPLEGHDGHVWLTMAIAWGATVVLGASPDPAATCAVIDRHRVSYLICSPTTTDFRQLDQAAIGSADLSCVRLVQLAAGAISTELFKAIYRLFPACQVGYGWSQAESGLGTSLVVTPELLASPDRRLGSIGQPMPLSQVRLVDDAGRDLPPDQVGECLIQSEAVMSGYLDPNEPAAQALPGDGWLHTGEMMVRDEAGFYYFKYHKRDMITSGGTSVFAPEVASILRSHPDVLDCAVYGLADWRLGQTVAATVEPAPQAELTVAQLQAWCSERLPSPSRPRHFRLVWRLERDYSGQVDIGRLSRLHAEVVANQTIGPDQMTPPLGVTTRTRTSAGKVSVDPDIVRIRAPGAAGLVQDTLCYLVRSGSAALLIDAGADCDAAERAIRQALDEFGVTLDRLDVILTHEHVDHVGLLRRIGRQVRSVRATAACVDYVRREGTGADHLVGLAARLAAEGFEPAVIDRVTSLRQNRTRRWAPELLERWQVVESGQIIRVGQRELRVIATPGHAAGHLCLIEDETGAAFGGDHVLFALAPPVMAERGAPDAMGDYLTSLDLLADQPVTTFFPAHGPRGDLTSRIKHLRSQHFSRLEIVTELAAQRPLRAADVVGQLGWSSPGDDWRRALPVQQWIIAAQTSAYIDHLVATNRLFKQADDDGRFTYTSTN